jgi:hypothetical protein
MSQLQLFKKQGNELLGEASLDLSIFAETTSFKQQLKLSNCEDPNGFIEVEVRAKEITVPGTPASNKNTPQIIGFDRKESVTSKRTTMTKQNTINYDLPEFKEQMDELHRQIQELQKANSKLEDDIAERKRMGIQKYKNLNDKERENMIALD